MKKQKEKEVTKNVFNKLNNDWKKTIYTKKDIEGIFVSKRDAYLRGKRVMYQKFKLLFENNNIKIVLEEKK